MTQVWSDLGFDLGSECSRTEVPWDQTFCGTAKGEGVVTRQGICYFCRLGNCSDNSGMQVARWKNQSAATGGNQTKVTLLLSTDSLLGSGILRLWIDSGYGLTPVMD